MTYKQIASILNTTIVPNILGEETTIAEDLSNIVDLGTKIADMTVDTMKDYTKQFAVGVAKNIFEGKAYKTDGLGLYRDSQEYAGAIQRIKMAPSQFEAMDTHIYTLESGQDYFDGKYYGAEGSATVFTKENGFKVPWSIPNEMFKTIFMSAEQVGSFVSLIEQTVSNAIAIKRHGLAKGVIAELVNKAYMGTHPRVYHLVTEYNAGKDAADQVTTATALDSPAFLRWAAMQISRLADGITEMSKKYNGEAFETFTAPEDVRVTLLSQFDKAISYNVLSDTYHDEKIMLPQFNTVPYWQNSTTSLVPNMGESATIKVKKESGSGNDTRTNVVGLVYSYYAAGITLKLDKITTQYIGSEDYSTFWHHIIERYFIDERNDAVVLALD